VIARYENRARLLEQQILRLGRRWNLLSYARGAFFFATLAAGLAAYFQAWDWAFGWWILAAICAAAFLLVVAVHDRLEHQLESSRHELAAFREGIARLRRDWNRLPIQNHQPPASFQPIALDLDVFGRASLAQLFGPVRTAVGVGLLTRWFTEPAVPEEIRLRQDAGKALSRQIAWRETFQLGCRSGSDSPVGSAEFLRWASSPVWLHRAPFWRWLPRISALIVLVFGVSFFTGWLPPAVSGVGLLTMLALHFVFSVFLSGRVHEVFDQVSSRKNEVGQYVALFGYLAQLPSESERLAELKGIVTQGADSAVAGMTWLARVVWLGNLRRHGILFLAYLFLQFACLWDLHVLFLLERWQLRYRDRVPDWFAALAQVEVLAACGTLAYEQPDWCWPDVRDDAPPQLVARQLGHPLLPDGVRIANDVTVGPPETVLIVTGSNMSGKSTLLRGIGLNVILAQMGSVACASSLSLPPLTVETSMRIDDSLADGVSFFMAELRRLKNIVDRAKLVRAGGGRFLFLLDEILQGTNSRERHIAVAAVIRQLVATGAIGAFTTHDLDLAKENELGQAACPVHFIESFEKTPRGDVMTFDYRMRQGIAPTTNALHLLRLVGLGGDDGHAGR
jgi:hypothetical protein